MKKILVGAVLALALGGYVFFANSQSAAVTAANSISDSPQAVSSQENQTAPAIGSNPPVIPPSARYKDGAYIGDAASSIYGNIQVSATILGGKIVNVTFLQYPNDNGHSREVSAAALPLLKSEAIASQSASVNIVSGATQTSEAFRESMQSALAQAVS